MVATAADVNRVAKIILRASAEFNSEPELNRAMHIVVLIRQVQARLIQENKTTTADNGCVQTLLQQVLARYSGRQLAIQEIDSQLFFWAMRGNDQNADLTVIESCGASEITAMRGMPDSTAAVLEAPPMIATKKKTTPKKAVAKKSAPKKKALKKPLTKKTTTKKSVAKKTTENKAAPKKVAPKKVAPKKVAPKKAAPKKAAPKKVAPKKAAPKKAAPKKSVAKKKTAKKGVAKKAGPKKAAPPKASAKKTSPKKATRVSK